MKIQIRQGVFETNSSSTHAICICMDNLDKKKFTDTVEFKRGEFGWDFKVYKNVVDKASYLYQAICDMCSDKQKNEYINKLYSTLGKYGVDSSFDDREKDEDGFSIGYIDHGYNNLRNFVESVMRNEKRLLKFLFGNSEIVTDNDNTDHFQKYMDSKSFKNYEVYYKGN